MPRQARSASVHGCVSATALRFGHRRKTLEMRQRRRVGPRAVYRSPVSGGGTPAFARAEGFLPGARKDGQSVRSDWLPSQKTIDGVQIREVRNVEKGQGLLTEIFRADWCLDEP